MSDFVTSYIFGLKNGTDFIRNPSAAKTFFRDFKARQVYTFWPQELPSLTNILFRLGLGSLLIPTWVSASNTALETWLLSMCDAAESTLLSPSALPEDHPTVYSQLRHSLLSSSSSSSSSPNLKSPSPSSPFPAPLRLTLASELLDHALAGYDTSGITLTFLAWELSLPRNAHWQLRLRRELTSLSSSSSPSSPSSPGGARNPNPLEPKLLDRLPVLHAVLMETLRLHAPIPGNQPRVTPAGAMLGSNSSSGEDAAGLRVGPLPAGVRVQAQAWSLHRNPEVFPSPLDWEPGRWLEGDGSEAEDGDGDEERREKGEERRREMMRWFWAFGSGGRMCVGSNLAMLDMKAAVAGVWGNFGTEIVDDEGMVHNGGYIAEPRGVGPEGGKGVGKRFLVLRLTGLEG